MAPLRVVSHGGRRFLCFCADGGASPRLQRSPFSATLFSDLEAGISSPRRSCHREAPCGQSPPFLPCPQADRRLRLLELQRPFGEAERTGGGARLSRRQPLQTADGSRKSRRAARPLSPSLLASSAVGGSPIRARWRKAAGRKAGEMPGLAERPRSEENPLPRCNALPALPPGTFRALHGRASHASTLCREILQGQAPILTFQDGRATLQVQDGGQSMTFDLDKASVPEARRQLQDLTFGLVEQLQTLEKRLEEGIAAATSVALRSPEKISASQSLLGADFSPRKPRGGASPSKRRLPGESLINPGFRSKKTPTGVDFEDA
ncbi:hypothetical protein E2320_006575 [Naja naja]|nr:hypothetical protein E2320_006575 [Naja naja]